MCDGDTGEASETGGGRPGESLPFDGLYGTGIYPGSCSGMFICRGTIRRWAGEMCMGDVCLDGRTLSSRFRSSHYVHNRGMILLSG